VAVPGARQWPSPGRPAVRPWGAAVAVPGEAGCPSLGRFRDCPWGIVLTAAGEIPVAVDNYGVKRPENASWPRPTLRPAQAVRVLGTGT
jgi:hypothetical protein